MHDLPKIREWRNVDLATFRNEIVPAYRPAVLKGLVADWKLVREAKTPQAIVDYFRRFDTSRVAQAFIGKPENKGRYFYADDMRGVNFERRDEPFSETLARLECLIGVDNPETSYVGSAPIPELLPEFRQEIPLDIVHRGIPPRLWFGNASVVATHFDLSDNVACVAGGSRRFTLFPPDQISNLYIGPIDFTLAGQPCSMVDLNNPDFERFPRFRDALAHAQTADLEPGDAIYVPYLWWHHVQGFDPINVLVNYWWNDSQSGHPDALEALVHALMTIRANPEPRREAWRAFFEHYVFEKHGDPSAHLRLESKGILGPMNPRLSQFMKNWLLRVMNR